MGLLGNIWNRVHVNTFIKACKYGDEPQVISMLSDEPELAYTKDKSGISALLHAVGNGHSRIVEEILRITKQPDDVDPQQGFSPLIISATNGHIALVRLLLNFGADPNLQNSHGVTALHNAVYEDQYDIALLLIESGADPNIKDKHGVTAHELSIRGDNEQMLLLLNS